MPLTLKPVDRLGPHFDVLAPTAFPRGLAMYWPAEPTKPRRRRKGEPKTQIMRVWHCQTFIFSALRDDRDDRPPKGKEETLAMVLRAYALAATHHPIPSDAEVLYEVRT